MTFNDRNQDKTQAEAPLKHRWGTRFKAAREAMNLTEKDVAARLHLKPTLIAIIETERFESGPPPIFMRGYIRSYARLLNMPEKEIAQALAQLDLANPATSAPVIPTRSRVNQPNNSSNVGWSTSLVVLVLVGLVGMWWNTHYRNNPRDVNDSMQPAQAITPVASNPMQNTNTVPADPTPKELTNAPAVVNAAPSNPAPVMAPVTAPVTAPVATNAAPVVASAPTAPEASTPAPTPPVVSNPTVAAVPPVDPATNPATNPAAFPAEAQTSAPATNDFPAITPGTGDPAAALPDGQTDEADAKPVKHKSHHKTPEMASDEMDIPEQGLDPADNNN